MKKFIAVFAAFAVMLCLCACGGGGEEGTTLLDGESLPSSSNQAVTAVKADNVQDTGDPVPTVLNTTEYLLYQNIFYNDTGDDYVGQTMTKTGTFTRIRDSYNNTDRYYVWGYNDQTKCCDWQWEFVPTDAKNLPSPGTQIEMTGKFAASDKALDGYWFEDATYTVKSEYSGPKCDIDMTTMGGTLERVQLANMNNFASEYNGKQVYAYGRVASLTSIQDPYYNGSWEQKFTLADGSAPAIGTMVILNGVFKDGVIEKCAVSATARY